MRKFLFLSLLMFQFSIGSSLADEFMIGPYRAYSLMGEAKLTDSTDYISFAGDFGFSSWLPTNEVINRHLAYESDLLSHFRLSVVNLEAMLPGVSENSSDVRIDDFVMDALKKAGYGMVAFANNHALDYGPEGVKHNTTQLAKAGLAMIGTRGSPIYEWEAGGKKIAIFALTDSLDKEDRNHLILT